MQCEIFIYFFFASIANAKLCQFDYNTFGVSNYNCIDFYQPKNRAMTQFDRK